MVYDLISASNLDLADRGTQRRFSFIWFKPLFKLPGIFVKGYNWVFFICSVIAAKVVFTKFIGLFQIVPESITLQDEISQKHESIKRSVNAPEGFKASIFFRTGDLRGHQLFKKPRDQKCVSNHHRR